MDHSRVILQSTTSRCWSKLAALDGVKYHVPHLARQCEWTTAQSVRHKKDCTHPAPPSR
eukprot:m.220999 g.220999  ORF g.220999 m.220999 type:complete len:59 (-) comp25798_c2_seq1:45-221(-)